MKILIIDDNRDLADGLAFVLEDEGHEVLVAYAGEQGINTFREAQPDAVFLDYKLPDMTGMDVYQSCLAERPDARIVLMSAYRIEQLIGEFIKAKVQVLRKPFSVNDALDAITGLGSAGIALIVDDDTDFAEGVAQLLEERGHRALIATDGQQAVDEAMIHNVDVMILDLRLPVLHGLSVYLELKKRGKTIPTVIVTAYGKEEKETVDYLKSLSVTGILFKPFNPERLLEIVDNIKVEADL